MSRRRHTLNAVAMPGGEVARRVLLGAVTALLVARPMALGEDPGRQHSPEAASGVLLNLLWLIAAVAASIWAAATGRSFWRGGGIALALLFVAATIGVSAEATACYRYPAWLLVWEWATLAMAFLLVRSLTADRDDAVTGIANVFAASAVSLAAFAVYQWVAPRLGLSLPESMSQIARVLPPDSDFHGSLEVVSTSATFRRPDTLLALLLLAMPLVFAMSFGRGWRRRVVLISVGVLAFAAISTIIAMGADFGTRWENSAETAVSMTAERPLFGVGPENFDRHSARLQSPCLPEVLPDGGSAYLDAAANLGLVGLGAIVVVFLLILLQRRSLSDNVTTSPPESTGPRWEFQLGGMGGLFLGIVLAIIDMPAAAPPQALLHAGIAAAARSLVWFFAFTLFDAFVMSARARRLALTIGVALVAVLGVLSIAPLLPAVMQPVIVLAALLPSAARGLARPWLRWAPVAATLVVAIVFLFLVADPVYQSAAATTRARRAMRLYPSMFAKAEALPPGLSQRLQMEKLGIFLRKEILVPLGEARRADPMDTGPPLHWAAWYRPLWKIVPTLKQDEGIAVAQRAVQLDPRATAPLVAELQLRLAYAHLDPSNFRQGPERNVDPKVAKYVLELRADNLREAESLVARIAERDPALETRSRFRLAQTLLSLPDSDRHKDGLSQANEVWRLEEHAVGTRARLTAEQRRLVRRWLRMPPEDSEWWLLIPVGSDWVVVPIAGKQ